MKVTQEKLPASQIGLEIEITPEMSQKAYEQVIQKFTRTANIPGFRKGKVPRQVLVQRFGSMQLKATALEELIDETLKQAIEQEKIDALGNFQLRSSFEELVSQFAPGSALTFSASVDVQPEVTLQQYTDFQLQAEEIKPDAERVEKVLQQYQEQTATLIPVEGRAAQFGDTTVIDYKGVLVSDDPDAEPEPFPGGEAEDFQVELAEGKFIEGFIDGIVGMNPGETKDLPIPFPADYTQETLAGRDAIFTITLKEIKEKELPALDDDFAQEVSEFKTLAELRSSLEARYVEEADEKTKANKEQAILDELLKHIEVELPETLIEREMTYLLNQTAMQLQNQGIDVKRLFNQDTIPMLKERSRPEAIDRIKRTLALGEVAKRESIKVEPNEVKAKVTELMAELGDRDIDPDRLQAVVTEDLLKEKIVDWLLERSTVELVPEGTLAKPEDNAEADDIEANEAEVTETAANSTIDVTPVVDTEASNTTDVVDATETEPVALDAALPSTQAVGASDETSATDNTTDTEKPKKARKAAKAKAESSDSE
ncbi:trigger factor [Leptolyngbya sp. FACHB-321]|uniref:trigger factor n=1 Tax=Leptolyngbya sp. FACHB-321 TaxID=2692807 RepID=UPI0016844A85|nr:trigger factor [Leptolyngbya sp. FACHB-321]MBD2038409.1 trigger factor [Leptolyngbya sp. FACHB-321]